MITMNVSTRNEMVTVDTGIEVLEGGPKNFKNHPLIEPSSEDNVQEQPFYVRSHSRFLLQKMTAYWTFKICDISSSSWFSLVFGILPLASNCWCRL